MRLPDCITRLEDAMDATWIIRNPVHCALDDVGLGISASAMSYTRIRLVPLQARHNPERGTGARLGGGHAHARGGRRGCAPAACLAGPGHGLSIAAIAWLVLPAIAARS